MFYYVPAVVKVQMFVHNVKVSTDSQLLQSGNNATIRVESNFFNNVTL